MTLLCFHFIFLLEDCRKSFLQKFGNHYKISIPVGRLVLRSPFGARTFLFAQTRLHRAWGPPSLFQMVSGLFPGQSSRGVVLTTHRHLAPRLKKKYSSTSTPSLGLHGALYGKCLPLIIRPQCLVIQNTTN